MRYVIPCVLAAALVAGSGYNAAATAANPSALKQTAVAIAHDVAVVREVMPKGAGSPVYIFPEDHVRKDGQYEETVSLLRLNRLQGVVGIVLEGMSPRKEAEVAATPTSVSLASALTLIQEGEISAAEFMRLVYGTSLFAGETQATASYKEADGDVDLCLDLTNAVNQYQRTKLGTNWHPDAKLEAAIGAINKTSKEMSAIPEAKTCQNRTLFFAKYRELKKENRAYLEASASYIPALASAAWLCSASPATGMRQIEDGMSSLQTASTFIRSEPELKAEKLASALDAYRRSLKSRDDASTEMVRQAVILSRQARGPVAMIIGAAHTRGVTSRLKQAGIPYAVIENKALNRPDNQAQTLTIEQVGRLYGLLPVANTPLDAALVDSKVMQNDCNLSGGHKNESNLSLPWFQEKAKIYQSISEFGRAKFMGAHTMTGAWNGIIDDSRARIFKSRRTGEIVAVVAPVRVARAPVPPGTTVNGNASSIIWVVIKKGNLFRKDGGKISGQDAEAELMALAGDGGGVPPRDETPRSVAHSEPPEGANGKDKGPEKATGKDTTATRDPQHLEIHASSDVKFSSFRDEKSALDEAQRESNL